MNAAAAQLGISRIGQIAINVRDLDRATAFYRDTLGLPFLFSAGKLTFFDCGGVRLMLSRPERPDLDHPGSILYFVVPDIKAAHRQGRSSPAPRPRSEIRGRATTHCQN